MSARMDMTELLADPDFAERFTVTRSQESADDHGRQQASPTTFPVVGVIQPASPEQVESLPEANRSSSTIAVYSPELLTDGSETLAADLVAWEGQDYRVVSVEDRMAAAGYCLALAVSVDLVGKEPA